MTAALFAAMKCAVRVRLLRFKGECIAALTLGRRTGRTHAADAGGSGLACLHGRITAAMSCLSTVRDAVVVCPGTGRRHRDKRKCEQRRSRGCERRRIPFHFFVLCVPSARAAIARRRIPRRGVALRLMTRDLCAAPILTTRAACIAAMSKYDAYHLMRIESTLRQNDQLCWLRRLAHAAMRRRPSLRCRR